MMNSAMLPDLTAQRALRMVPGMLRRMLPMLLLDGALPLALYFALRPRFTPGSVVPLAVAVVSPLLANIVSIMRRRRLDTMGALVLVSLVASIAVALLGGDQRFLLITRSVVMPVMGLTCLVSLLWAKPLAFSMIRQFLTGDAPQPAAVFDALWRYPYVRAASRLMTLVWGIAMVGEFVVRAFVALTLPIAAALIISSAIMMGIGLGLGAWNVAYGLHVLRRVRRLDRDANGVNQLNVA